MALSAQTYAIGLVKDVAVRLGSPIAHLDHAF